MPKGETTSFSVRAVPVEWIQRADALIAAFEQDPEMAGVKGFSRATVLRAALLRGLEALEDKYREVLSGE